MAAGLERKPGRESTDGWMLPPQDSEVGYRRRISRWRKWMLKFSLTKTGSAGRTPTWGRLAHRFGFQHVYLWGFGEAI